MVEKTEKSLLQQKFSMTMAFDSFCFTDSFEALLSSVEASYLSITDAAQKQIKDQLQNSDSLTGVQIIVRPDLSVESKI